MQSEFKSDHHLLANVDTIVQAHDRSRFSEDEFYAAANHFGAGLSVDNVANDPAFRIAQLKHAQRNAHDPAHYVYRVQGSTSQYTAPMPIEFAWDLLLSWISCWNDDAYDYTRTSLKNGDTPFQFFWGRDSNRHVVSHYHTNTWGSWYTYTFGWLNWETSTPRLANYIPLDSQTKLNIARIVDRWSCQMSKPADETPPGP